MVKQKTQYIIKILFPILLLIIISCKENPTNPIPGPPRMGIVAHPAYDSPAWHPIGNFIGFNYTPLDSVNNLTQYFNDDSTGFWLVNINGTNKRRILPFKLQTPAWSPDGKWIAFVSDAHIYKMPFTNGIFDTTTIVQLTNSGNNYFPSWSPDGQWIAYDSDNYFNESGYKIWKMRTDGTEKSLVAEGRMSSWSYDSQWVFYIGFHNEVFMINITDTTEIIQITHLNENNIYATDNRFPQTNYNNSLLAFSLKKNSETNSHLCVIDLLSNNLQQLFTVNVHDFSWASNGEEIVYTKHNWNNWSLNNGVLWIINVNSKKERQLTYNR